MSTDRECVRIFSRDEIVRAERAEAAAQRATAIAQRRIDSHTDADTADFADGVAVRKPGPDPLWSRVFALGLTGPVTKVDVDAIEAWFVARGRRAKIDLSPLADASLFEILGARSYVVEHFDVVLMRDAPKAGHEPSPVAGVGVEVCDDMELWIETSLRGIASDPLMAEGFHDKAAGLFSAEGVVNYLARVDGELAGACQFFVQDGVGLMHTGSTVPAMRGRGVQTAMLKRRIADARTLGCDLLATQTDHLTISQRNQQRLGFEVVLSRPAVERRVMGGESA